MKPPLDLRRVTLGLVFLLILVMANQLQFELPFGSKGKPAAGDEAQVGEAHPLAIPVADVVLLLAFAGVILSVGSRKLRGIKLPPLQAWALVAAAGIALLHSRGRSDGAKDIIQLAEYFLVAFFVFANVAETRDLKAMVTCFAIATALVVAWAACQYANPNGSAFRVSAGYDNRNGLGAFLAIAVPMLYGLALYARHWPERVLLLILVAAGLLVDLSGASVLISLVVLAVLSAIRGRRILVAYLGVLGLVLVFAPRILPRPYHTDVLIASVSPYVDDNYLLSDAEMVAQARELLEPTNVIVLDHSDEKGTLDPMPLDAGRLLRQLADRRLSHQRLIGGRRPLTPEETQLQIEIEQTIQDPQKVPLDARQSYPLDKAQVAVRYQRWNAVLTSIRSLWDPPRTEGHGERRTGQVLGNILFGRGLARYHDLFKGFMTNRLQYRTDLPEVFNVAAPEPFTFDIWFKAFLQMGVLGFLALLWLVGAFLGRAVALWRDAHSEFALGVALGSLGSILGFALGGLFTESIARGIAIPFVFILAALTVAERIVYGERKTPIEHLTRVD